jgi:hypothetical protein
MVQIENRQVSRNTNPEIFAKAMENPFPKDGVYGTASAGEGESLIIDEQGASQVALADEVGNPARPDWFHPSKFSVSAGLGWSIHKISVDRTIEMDFSDDVAVYGYTDDNVGYSGDNQLAVKIDLSYSPFGSFSAFLGYQVISPIEGHEVQAGLRMHPRIGDLTISGGIYYSHLWASGEGIESNIDENDVMREVFVPDTISMHGLGFTTAFDYSIMEEIRIGAYVDMAVYFKQKNGGGLHSGWYMTPGLRAVVDF